MSAETRSDDHDARILVIHENDEIISHNTINLVALGYRVHSVDAANMGLKLLAADPDGWTIVLLKDSRNSHTHLRNVVSAIRETAPHVKVVLITDISHAYADVIHESVSAIIEWPYDARQLTQAISGVTARR